jgi:hypothetical protein
MITFRYLAPLAALSLMGCETPTSEQADMVANLSSCEKVLALVDEHPNQFSQLRLNSKSTGAITVWDARYHLVGNSCQVWGWGKGKNDYVCSKTAPNKAIAQEYFDTAKQLTSSCIGDNWTLSEQPRKVGTGIKAVFSRESSPTVIAVHAVETKGLFKDEWTTYFFVGASNKDI